MKDSAIDHVASLCEEQEQKFLDLIQQHRQIIYKVCFMYANNDEAISDLYQEAVLNLWTAFPRFRGESKTSTWVYRICVNTCITNLRQTKRRPDTISLTTSMNELFPDTVEKEQLHELYTLINRLGELERALIMLWLDERSYEEIAEILDISVSNVGVRINRIKTKLKVMSNN